MNGSNQHLAQSALGSIIKMGQEVKKSVQRTYGMGMIPMGLWAPVQLLLCK